MIELRSLAASKFCFIRIHNTWWGVWFPGGTASVDKGKAWWFLAGISALCVSTSEMSAVHSDVTPMWAAPWRMRGHRTPVRRAQDVHKENSAVSKSKDPTLIQVLESVHWPIDSRRSGECLLEKAHCLPCQVYSNTWRCSVSRKHTPSCHMYTWDRTVILSKFLTS